MNLPSTIFRQLLSFLVLFAFPLLVSSQENSAVNTAQRTYYGDIEGYTSTLKFEVIMDTLTGRIETGGYTYELSASMKDDTAYGLLRDPQTGGEEPFTFIDHKDSIQLVIGSINRNAGGASTVIWFFNKPLTVDKLQGTFENDRITDMGVDPDLCGKWVLQPSPTRTYPEEAREIYDFREDGGLMLTSIPNTDHKEDEQKSLSAPETVANWRAKNGILYLHYVNDTFWFACEYTIEDTYLLIQFADGSRNIFLRTNN